MERSEDTGLSLFSFFDDYIKRAWGASRELCMLCGEYAMGLVLVSSMIEHLELKHFVSEKDFVESILGLSRDRRRYFRRRSVRERIYYRHKGRCFYCDHAVAYQDMEVDHLLPWSLGGRTVEENGVCSCRPCNRRKGKRIW